MKNGLIRADISTGTSHLRHTQSFSSTLIRNVMAPRYINAALRTVNNQRIFSLSLSLSNRDTAIIVNNRLIPLGLDIFSGTHRARIRAREKYNAPR